MRLPGIGCGTYTKKLPKARRQILELVFLGAIGVCEAKYRDLKISKRFPYDPDNPNTDLFHEVPCWHVLCGVVWCGVVCWYVLWCGVLCCAVV